MACRSCSTVCLDGHPPPPCHSPQSSYSDLHQPLSWCVSEWVQGVCWSLERGTGYQYHCYCQYPPLTSPGQSQSPPSMAQFGANIAMVIAGCFSSTCLWLSSIHTGSPIQCDVTAPAQQLEPSINATCCISWMPIQEWTINRTYQFTESYWGPLKGHSSLGDTTQSFSWPEKRQHQVN